MRCVNLQGTQHTNTTNFTILFFISIYLNNNYIEYQLLGYPGFCSISGLKINWSSGIGNTHL